MSLQPTREPISLTAAFVAQGSKRRRITQLLRDRSFHSVYQPIVDLRGDQIVGFECLTRFSGMPCRSPAEWFEDAADVGLGVALELQTFKAALRECADLPASAFIALNVSPQAIVSGWISAILKAVDPVRVVLELTEHAPVTNYSSLHAVLDPLRARGVRVAIDDVGAGYANLQHILELRPDLLKLDVTLVRDVDACPARAALLSGMVHFARAFGCQVLAEGVETAGQMAVLRLLGVDLAQGYLLGRPDRASHYCAIRHGLRPASTGRGRERAATAGIEDTG